MDICFPKIGVFSPYPQNLHGTLRPNCVSGMVTMNRLQTLTNALSNSYDALASFLAPVAGTGRLAPATVQCVIYFW